MTSPSQSFGSSASSLSVGILGPSFSRRAAMIEALGSSQVSSVREFDGYPSELDDLKRMLEPACDVVIVDLDGDPEYALEIVEAIHTAGLATVFVCSSNANLEMAVRCMRVGAREFLTFPLDAATIASALSRIAVRGSSQPATRKTARKLFVFLGSKGGCGNTTLAANFAVALAQESGQSTLLIDFGSPLGDAAINLGMTTDYSTHNAVENHNRLDGSFLNSLLAKHSSGLSILAAPTEFPPHQPSLDALDKLVAVARSSFDYVVIDAGSRIEFKDARFLDDSANLYLVTQVGVTELRNANRMIGQYFASRGPKLQIVVNRYAPQLLLFDDKQIEKALTRSIDWKVPDDYASARRTQIAATALVMEDSTIARIIRRMARKAAGLPELDEKKARAGVFGWAKRGLSKLTPEQREAQDREPTPAYAHGMMDPDHL